MHYEIKSATIVITYYPIKGYIGHPSTCPNPIDTTTKFGRFEM